MREDGAHQRALVDIALADDDKQLHSGKPRRERLDGRDVVRLKVCRHTAWREREAGRSRRCALVCGSGLFGGRSHVPVSSRTAS
mgnify:CR=1 FL=1